MIILMNRVQQVLPNQYGNILHVFYKWWSSAHPGLWATKSFKNAPRISDHEIWPYDHLLTMTPFTFEIKFCNIPSLLLTLSRLLWYLLMASNPVLAYIFSNLWR